MSKHKVLVTRRVPSECISLLTEHGLEVEVHDSDEPIPLAVLLDKVSGCHALFCLLTDKVSSSVLDAAGPQLKVVATMSVGCDHLDIPSLKKRNIKIGYTPDVLTNSTAELGISLLLSVTRRLMEGVLAVKCGEWSSWKPLWMCGVTLDGATVGIIGLGRIGERMLEMLQPFRVARFLYSGHRKKECGDRLGAEFVDTDRLLMESDVVIVSCALTADTKHLLNKRAFGMMKTTAVLINISRGDVVDQDALLDALRRGEIGAAGLDVTCPEPLPTDHPLLSLHNCVVLPHIGSATVKARTAMAMLTARNIIAALNDEPMPAQLS